MENVHGRSTPNASDLETFRLPGGGHGCECRQGAANCASQSGGRCRLAPLLIP